MNYKEGENNHTDIVEQYYYNRSVTLSNIERCVLLYTLLYSWVSEVKLSSNEVKCVLK